MIRSFSFLGLMAFLPSTIGSACYRNHASVESFKETDEHAGINQAAFDLHRPADKLVMTDLQSAVGVERCGRRAVYKWVRGAGWIASSQQEQ